MVTVDVVDLVVWWAESALGFDSGGEGDRLWLWWWG